MTQLTEQQVLSRLAALPLILAGPIVRKVTKTEVSIWFALKEPKVITVQLFEGTNTHVRNGEASTIQAGANLHIALVTLKFPNIVVPNQPDKSRLEAGGKYFYNVFFQDLSVAGTALGASPGTDVGQNKVNVNIKQLWTEGVFFPPSVMMQTTPNYTPFIDDDDKNVLTYSGEDFPGFLVPPDNVDDLMVVHASCRKPHGGFTDAVELIGGWDVESKEDAQSHKDVLTILDETISSSRNNSFPSYLTGGGIVTRSPKTPHILFLTGDQIYADDVHSHLLTLIREASEFIFHTGFLEEKEKAFGDMNIGGPNSKGFKVNNRAQNVLENAKFPAGHYYSDDPDDSAHYGYNHLIHPSEYFMMYLFAWSPVLWPSNSELKNMSIPQTNLYVSKEYGGTKFGDKHIDVNAFYKENLRNLEVFSETLPQVRRLFANISTYMMFDDHDVTDDWFLNYQTTKETLDSTLGNYIIRGGLMGIALFQAWGNKPDYFNPKNNNNGSKLINEISKWYKKTIDEAPNYIGSPTINELSLDLLIIPEMKLDYDPNKPGYKGVYGHYLSSRVNWHFNLEFVNKDKNGYQIAVLDTRTKRWFKSSTYPLSPTRSILNREPAGLINPDMINDQIPEKKSNCEVTIIVSPAPMLGLISTESVQIDGLPTQTDGAKKLNSKWITHKHPQSGFSEYDVEAWIFNGYCWDDVFFKLLEHENIVILSGDVHYGFTAKGHLMDLSDPGGSYKQTSIDEDTHSPPPGNPFSFRRLRIMQCTASSSKNETDSTVMANQGHKNFGSPWKVVITDERDDYRTEIGALGGKENKLIRSKSYMNMDPRFQFFANQSYLADEDINNYSYHTYPTRLYYVDYEFDDRKPWHRVEGSENNSNYRYVPGYNNFGVVNFNWNNSKKEVEHFIVFREGRYTNVASTMHTVDFEDSTDDPTPTSLYTPNPKK